MASYDFLLESGSRLLLESGSALDLEALITDVNASAGSATITFTAYGAAPADAPTSGQASVTFTAYAGTTKSSPSAGQASITFTAYAPSAKVNANAGQASITFTGYTAGVSGSPIAGQASITFVAYGSVPGVGTRAGQASITFTAYNAAALTGAIAPAGQASITFTANNPTGSVSPGAGQASVTFTAYAGTTKSSPSAGQASITFTAYAPSAKVNANAGQASITFTGYTASTKIATTAGSGSIAFTAYNVTPLTVGVVLVLPTAAELLDLDDILLRIDSVRFDVLDQTNQKIGELAVSRKSPPTITNDVNRQIRRSMDGVRILPRPPIETESLLMYAEDINPATHRVQPVWIVGPGGPGYEFPLGVFLFADAPIRERSYGETIEASFVDQCLILAQPLTATVAFEVGTVISNALTTLSSSVGIVSLNIETTTRTIPTTAVYAIGRSTTMSAMEDLCVLAGFLPPYFDNDGTLICRSAPNLEHAEATLFYDTGARIMRGTLVDSSDLLFAPNYYIVLDTSNTDTPVVGRFQVPAAAPFSFEQRGFYVVSFTEVQGLSDQAAADAAAAAKFGTDSAGYRWRSWSSPADPRHDTFDVVALGEDRTIEKSWTLLFPPGARHDHDTRGVYTG